MEGVAATITMMEAVVATVGVNGGKDKDSQRK
ncbi:uncharacterized protein G2W53_005561 [Senna tora]|uniref:Uncharacterized protein n=1 Tax=Senna tora TaxID=362788 RepID=A0A834X379_9FABA|nr:uncharacterized protein G2W53_005561 [Senna tora]